MDTPEDERCTCGEEEGFCRSYEHDGALRVTFFGSDNEMHVVGTGALMPKEEI